LLAIILVFALVFVEEVRFGMMAERELARFRGQLLMEIQDLIANTTWDVHVTVENEDDESDWWKKK